MSERTVSTRTGPQPAPLKISNYGEYTRLVSWYKQLLIPHLPVLAVNRTPGAASPTNLTTTQRAPNSPPIQIIPQDNNTTAHLSKYTLAQLWSSVIKHWSAEEVADGGFAGRLRMWRGRVKMALQRDVYGVWVPFGGRASIRAGKKEIAKWVIMHNSLLTTLPKTDEKEWRLLCGLIVASQGGKFLELDFASQSSGPSGAPRIEDGLDQGRRSPDSSQSSIISCSSETEDGQDINTQLGPPPFVPPTRPTTTTNTPPRYEPRSSKARGHYDIEAESPRSISPTSSTQATIGVDTKVSLPFSYAGTSAAEIMQEFQRQGQVIYRG